MSPERVRLNITLPLSLTNELNRFSGPRKPSRFIAETIELKIRQLKEKELERSLAEGYSVTKRESLEISGEFEPIDIGNWDEY